MDWGFFEEYWQFLVLVAGILTVITLGYLLYNLHNRLKLKHRHPPQKNDANREVKISLKELIDTEIMKTPEKTPESPQIVSPDAQPPVQAPKPANSLGNSQAGAERLPLSPPQKMIAGTTATQAASPKTAATPAPLKPDAPTAQAADADAGKKKQLGKYHVLYRKEDKRWYIKREGSDKILRVLDTQREAIAYATIKAITQDTGFIIHNQDGKIRKVN